MLPEPSEIPPSTSSNPANVQNFHWIMTYCGLVGNKQQYYTGTILPCSLLTLNPTQQPLDIYIYIWQFPKIGGPQYRPRNTMILIMGTPKKVPPILGNPHIYSVICGQQRGLILSSRLTFTLRSNCLGDATDATPAFEFRRTHDATCP